MITAPILAATRYKYFDSRHGMFNPPEIIALDCGWAFHATSRNTSSNAPMPIAMRSTDKYDPVYAITVNPPTTTVIVSHAGTPKINPTPARPLSSLNSAPTHAKTSVPTEIQAHLRPK